MLTACNCMGKNNKKAVWISKIHVVFFVFLIVMLFVEKSMGDDFITYKGYCIAEHELASGQRVSVSKTSMLHIGWMLKNDQTIITHIQFRDLMVTNLKTGQPVMAEKVNSAVIPIHPLASIGYTEGRLNGAGWMIDENELPVNQMQEFVDYRVSGIAVELIDNKEMNRKKFEIFLMRDYKSVPAATLKGVDNWTVGSYSMISKDSTPVVLLKDSMYNRKLGRILKVRNYGKLSIANGEIVFDEIADKREVYYNEMINEEYKRVKGKLKRFWDYKRHDVDNRPYAYKTIYERGYSDKSHGWSKRKRTEPLPSSIDQSDADKKAVYDKYRRMLGE